MIDRTPTPILEILDALPMGSASGLGHAPLLLRVLAGECVLIQTQHQSQSAEFGDLCSGVLPLNQGTVRFSGHDWTHLAHEEASALRGQIGRVYNKTSWIGFLGTDMNILLSQLHHTWRSDQELRNAAAALSLDFGLPGLPTGHPDSLGSGDLVRAACVRAFIGEPRLLILDGAELEQVDNLMPALMQALAEALNRHAASIWLTHTDFDRNTLPLSATARLRLTDRGLVPMAQ